MIDIIEAWAEAVFPIAATGAVAFAAYLLADCVRDLWRDIRRSRRGRGSGNGK